MALIKSEWRGLGSPISASAGWQEAKGLLRDVDNEMANRGVYVIRTCRPFSIAYPKKASPVLYIGEGQTKKRLKSHLQNWIVNLASDFPSLQIDIRLNFPRVRNNTDAHKEVEADLLWKFCEIYGALPLLNRQNEYHNRTHTYSKGFFNILNPGSGRGFKWALLPISSNNNYIRPVEVEDE